MSDHEDIAPISLRDARLKRDPAARPWSFRLHVLVRCLAAAEFAKGLWHWATLIGVRGAEPFAEAATATQVKTVVFAVADLVAAVGLWLGAAWGVVIWLLAASGQMLAGGLAPGGGQEIVIAAEVVAMGLYLALSLLAKREDG